MSKRQNLPLYYTNGTLFNNVTSGAVLTSANLDISTYENIWFRLEAVTQVAVGAVASISVFAGFTTTNMSAFGFCVTTAGTAAPTGTFGLITSTVHQFGLLFTNPGIRYIRYEVTSITSLGLSLLYGATKYDE